MNTKPIFTGLLLLLATLPAFAQTTDRSQALPVPVITVTPNPVPWSDLGAQVYGKNYQVYIPHEMKSDNPDAIRTWNAAGYPRNGNHMTPEGAACAEDADCKLPMECFNRADSGALPVKVCAFPPAY